MDIDILQQHLTDDTCPLCQHYFYEMEANIYGRLYHYFQCANTECQHQVFPQQDRICYCSVCRIQHKKQLEQSSREEVCKKYQQQIKGEAQQADLQDLSFLHKLFLLAVLENHVREDLTHAEYIHWSPLKYTLITSNYYFQKQMLQQFVQMKYLIKHPQQEECYYLNLSLLYETEPSLYGSIMYLRSLFYENLTQGVPFSTAEEVKQAIYHLKYQQIVQYCQFICKNWRIQIAGNSAFESFCYQLLQHLALSQIFYFIHQALHYLYKEQALQKQNEKFINTNLLKKTLQSYYKTANTEKWELYSIPYPEQMPMSHIDYILFERFLHLTHQEIYEQPIWKTWKKIETRFKFYEHSYYCIHCASKNVITEYEKVNHITLYCHDCQQRNYYFIST